MAVPRRTFCVTLLALFTACFLGLSGCGGGGDGDGGGGGGSSAFLRLTANMLMGQLTAGGTSTMPYPTDPALGVPVPPGSGAIGVPSAIFPLANLGVQSYIELRFNTTIDAATITTGTPSGNDGIVVLVTANGQGGAPPCALVPGAPVCMRLDPNGQVDPSNAIVGGVAPATLRMYYDPDNNLATFDRLPTGDYVLEIKNTLRAASGGPFCVGSGSASCSNDYLPVLPFTIGPNTTALEMAQLPMIPVCGEAAAPINSEIVLNFRDSVDFVTAAGGIANVSTLDPFVSVPFLLGMGALQGNVMIAYSPPTDPVTQVPQTLPATLGYIVYMPDPTLNPTQLRVRFVDTMGLQAVDAPGALPPTYQNYASNPLKYPIPSSDPAQNGALLQLPPVKAVPGSLIGSNQVFAPASVTVTVAQAVTDRNNVPGGTGNMLSAQFMCTFTWAVGPTVARNPVPPDAIFVGSLQGGTPPLDKPGITVVNTAATTGSNSAVPCTNVQVSVGAITTGVLTPTPANNRIANTQILGVPGDIEVGTFLNAGNFISDGPRGTPIPGVLSDQNGTAPSGILNCVNPMIPPPQPPYGNRLYVTDTTAGALKVFNSYDFSLITTVPGVASPWGLGMSPDLTSLYVSNQLQGTIQRVNINPLSPQFHTVINTTTVGNGPRAISVHPANEDVFVCNFLENSVSIVRPSTQLERASFPTGLGPSDVFITRRMVGQGLTQEYMAFIPNLFSNTVSVYESAGGLVVLENLPEGRMVATPGGFLGPGRGTWNWQTYLTITGGGPGALIPNTLGSSVDTLFLQSFTLSPPPGIPGPAGTRVFTHAPVFTSGGQNPSDVSIDNMSGGYNWLGFGLNNNKGIIDTSVAGSIPSVVVVSYPSLGQCVAYDYNSPALFSSVNIPGCDFLQAYYDQ
jgi:hypothetical protein